MTTYADLLIRIRGFDIQKNAYPVEAQLHDGQFYSGGELRLDEAELLALNMQSEVFGKKLFHALFVGPIHDAYIAGSTLAAKFKGRLRLRLWIDDEAAFLHTLSWERLFHPIGAQWVAVANSTQTPFSRYKSLSTPEPIPISERPLRMLFAIANPTNLPTNFHPVAVEQEIENLLQALDSLHKHQQLQISVMPGHTGLSTNLRSKMEHQGYQIIDGATSLERIARLWSKSHIFHFLGHGSVRKRPDKLLEAVLHLEDDNGKWSIVNDMEIATQLAAINPVPHLVFLAACKSGQTLNQHAFLGLGPQLVEANVPAVVAMRENVPMSVARQLTDDFYRNLFEHGSVDLALNQARNLLFKMGEIDWTIPVLFMRLKSGQLFEERKPPLQNVEASHFIVGNPITQPRYFFGREYELKRLFSLWQRPHLQNAAIVGPRRSGKTSLLHYLKTITTTPLDQLRPKQRNDWVNQLDGHRWIYVDFQDPRFSTQVGLLSHILTGLQLPIPHRCNLEKFIHVVSLGLHNPSIILLDEIGVALQRYKKLDDEFWEGLRSLTNNNLVNGKLAFVLAAHEAPFELAQHNGHSSPFFNIFGYTATLGPLSEPEALDLIKSSPVPFSNADIEWILQYSKRWPILLQILCRERLSTLGDQERNEIWQEESLRQMTPFRHLLEN